MPFSLRASMLSTLLLISTSRSLELLSFAPSVKCIQPSDVACPCVAVSKAQILVVFSMPNGQGHDIDPAVARGLVGVLHVLQRECYVGSMLPFLWYIMRRGAPLYMSQPLPSPY